MANVNIQTLIKTTTGLSSAQVTNFFLDANTPAEQLVAAVNVVLSAETALQNGASGTSLFVPLWDNSTGIQFTPTRLYFAQSYLANQSATTGAAGVFAGTAAATAALNFGLATQKTPVQVPTLLVPGTGPAFTTPNWVTSGPVNVFNYNGASAALFPQVLAGSASGTFNTGSIPAASNGILSQVQLTPSNAANATQPNSVLPNQTLYLQLNTSGTTSANLTVTAAFKVYVEGVLQPL